MLALAPYQVLAEIGTPSSKDEREGETDIPSPHGKKRTASEDLEIKASKRVKISLSGGYGSGDDVDMQFLRMDMISEQGCLKHIPFFLGCKGNI